MVKTKQQLEIELQMLQLLEKEREICKTLYAIKLVEKIVFAMVGMILVAFIGVIIRLVFR